MPEDEERLGFLSRWSRRKRGEEVPEAPPVLEPAITEALPAAMPEAALVEADVVEADVVEVGAPEPEFDVASLPPIETLDADSDFSVFLKPGVPHVLRTAALRKAWLADPLIRDYMSPLDYAWDFNTPGGLPYGFSNVLAETGEALRKLVNQAIGEMEPAEEKPEPASLAEASAPEPWSGLPPGLPLHEITHEEPAAAPLPVEASPPPEGAIRLSAALPAPAQAAPLEAPPPRPRRHGGALPV